MVTSTKKLLGFKYRNENNSNVPGWMFERGHGQIAVGCRLFCLSFERSPVGYFFGVRLLARTKSKESEMKWVRSYGFGTFFDFMSNYIVRQFMSKQWTVSTAEEWEDRKA